MSTLTKQEKLQQQNVNIAYGRLNDIQLELSRLQGLLALELSEEERAETLLEITEHKIVLVRAQGNLEDALDAMLGLQEEHDWSSEDLGEVDLMHWRE